MLLPLPKVEFVGSNSTEIRKKCKSQYDILDLEVLRTYVFRYLKMDDAILVASGGGGPSLNDVYNFIHNAGYGGVVYLVENEKTLKNIKKKSTKKGRTMNLDKGTLLEMNTGQGSLNVILDICSANQLLEKEVGPSLDEKCRMMFDNITNALKDGGRYLCLMDANDDIIENILLYFKEHWFVRLQSVLVSKMTAKQSFDVYSPLIMFILTKLKMKLPKSMIEMSIKKEKAVKVENENQIRKSVSQLWNYSSLQYKLRTEVDLENDYAVEFWCPKTNADVPRYTVIIVDTAKEDLSTYAGKYGVFLVPQGREIAWLFASEKGRRQLAFMSGFERIAVTLTHRGHAYGSLEEIQSELSTRILQLAPRGLNESVQVPFVTVGEDIGQRYTIYESGSLDEGCIVEDFKMGDGSFHRRLIFNSNPGIVQSEYRLLDGPVSTADSTQQCQVDPGYLVFSCHRRIVAALPFIAGIDIESELKILLVGLGGGSLPNFISKVFPKASVICIELDPEVVELAKKWFAFTEDSRKQAIITDGLEFMKKEIEQGNQANYDAVIFDVNTNDDTLALNAPPMAFIEADILDQVISLLRPSGVFILNLVCRDEDLRMEIANRIKGCFGNARISQGDEDELNVTLICLSPMRTLAEPTNGECVQLLTEISQRSSETNKNADMDLGSLVENTVVI